jgi:RHS repeat-associated protein
LEALNRDAPDTTQVRCIERDLPGAYMGMTRLLKRQTVWGPISWIGSVVQDGQDASGLSFRRNRYFDPSTGRFTQEDPIGIAGGLNVYGFGNGDPVGYSDPYGLCPKSGGGDGKTQGYADCPKGTSGYYAYQETQGKGGALNTFHGVVAACRENTICKVGGIALTIYGAWLVAGELTAGVAGRGALLASEGGAATGVALKVAVQFGRDPNQVSHAFRHIIDLGLEPDEVKAAVLEHLPTVIDQLQPGKPLNQIVTVNGIRLQYTAFQIATGLVNVGRIHAVP